MTTFEDLMEVMKKMINFRVVKNWLNKHKNIEPEAAHRMVVHLKRMVGLDTSLDLVSLEIS